MEIHFVNILFTFEVIETKNSFKDFDKSISKLIMQHWIDERVYCRVEPQQPKGDLI